MGNCIRIESSMQWGGEDWGPPAPETHFSGETSRGIRLYEKGMKMEEKRLLSAEKGGDSLFSPPSETTSSVGGAAAAAATEVKIKITKKQLEELLGRMEVQGLSVQQLIAQLMSVGDRFETHNQRPWRPALQSIPEVN